MTESLNIKRAISIIQRKAPSLDTTKLEELIQKNPHENATDYIVSIMFGNAFGYIPEDFPDIQKSYFNLSLYYFENSNIKDETHDPVLNISSDVALVCQMLLGESLEATDLKERLGSSAVYAQVAREIIQFYYQNKDNIKLLQKVGNALWGSYSYLRYPPEKWRKAKNKGYDISILKGIVKEKGQDFLDDPLIVRTVWERVKKKYKK